MLLGTQYHLYSFFNRSAESLRTARWYSSWILFLSLVPIFILYAVWIPLTLSGQLDNLSVDRNIKVEIGADKWGLTTYQEGEGNFINNQS